MCDALMKLMKPEFDAAVEIAVNETVDKAVKKAVDEAVKEAVKEALNAAEERKKIEDEKKDSRIQELETLLRKNNISF